MTAPCRDVAGGPVHPPRPGCRRNQHLPRGRTRFPQRRPRRPHAGAAAGALHAKQRIGVGLVGRGELDAHLGPISLQLLGEQHGERRGDPLAHLGAIHHDQHPLVRADAQPCVRRERTRRHRRSARARRQVKADDETGADDGRRFEELAPGDVCASGHVTPPLPRDGSRRGCGDKCHSGRCWSWRRRYRCRWGEGSSRAARRRS